MLAQERRGKADASDLMGGGILVREEENDTVGVPTPLGGFRLKRKRFFPHCRDHCLYRAHEHGHH